MKSEEEILEMLTKLELLNTPRKKGIMTGKIKALNWVLGKDSFVEEEKKREVEDGVIEE